MGKEKTVVIALGGNALGTTLEEQGKAVEKAAKAVVDMAVRGWKVVVTHGNGPQVGMIQGAMEGQSVGLPFSVAMSQGYIGIDLQNAIKYELVCRNMEKKVSTILSQVEVDERDPAFQHPSKPIGRFLTREEAEKKRQQGEYCMEDAGRGYRVAVASPEPVRIRELETIKTLLNAGHIVITCGGGGIPVVCRNGRLTGINAVIDKDKASSLLAVQLDAEYLLILTAVEKVAIHFGQENERWLSELTTEQARVYVEQGQFAKGSMLPKVEAAIRFAESGKGRTAWITKLERASDAVAGQTGTRIRMNGGTQE